MFWAQIQANRQRTIFLYVVFFILLAAVAWALDSLVGRGAALLSVGIGTIQAAVAMTASDKMALAAAGAREATFEENRFLMHTVEGLALAAQIPTPRCMIIDDPRPNAFATGLPHKNPTVAVTRGLMERLDRQEMEAVIAHEIAHIANHDTRVMTVAFVLLAAITVAGQIGMRMMLWGGGGRGSRRSRDSRGGAQLIILVLALLGIVLAPLAARLLTLAVSRNREFLADATAVRFTRNPQGLIGALRKISGRYDGTPSGGAGGASRASGAETPPATQSDSASRTRAGTPAGASLPGTEAAAPVPMPGSDIFGGRRAAGLATAHLWFSHPLQNGRMANLLSTHPPIEKRIERLQSM